jgi:hypothetical protein
MIYHTLRLGLFEASWVLVCALHTLGSDSSVYMFLLPIEIEELFTQATSYLIFFRYL